jgi:outer membrane receptor protein involved in Fe transport
LWDYEGGVKTKWLNGRLTADADVFWINWKNIQALQPVPGSILVVSGNAGTAVSRGAEAAVAYLVAKGLTVGANSAFTDAKFTESIPLVNVINGEPLFYVPRYTDTVYADYERPVAESWSGFVGGDYQYQSQRLDTNRMPLPGFATWNMHLGVHDAKNRVNLYINNLTNKLGLLGYGNGGYGAPYDYVVNTPRTVGITFTQSF